MPLRSNTIRPRAARIERPVLRPSTATTPRSPFAGRGTRLYVAGHRGLAGAAICRAASAAGYTDVVGATRAELDLRDRSAVFDWMYDKRPGAAVLAAAKVGGIVANDTYPADFLSDNLQIQTNLFDAAHAAGVGRLIFLPLPETGVATHPRGIIAHRCPRAHQ